MTEMIGYIFSSLEATEKSLRSQARINRGFMMFAVSMVAYSVLQNKRLEKLEKEMKEASETKGD